MLCSGLPSGAGLTSVRRWCWLNLSLECVIRGSGWVVLQRGRARGMLTLGNPRRYRPRSVIMCVFCLWSPSMSYKEIGRWLLLVLGFEVPSRVRAANQGWPLLVPGLGPLSEKYWRCWSQILLVWEILTKSGAWAKTGHWYGKASGNSLCEPTSWVVWGLWELPGWGKQVSQVDGVSDMELACSLCWV